MMSGNLKVLSGCLFSGLVLVACGNKGDLYLIPDPISQQDMQQLQRVLDSNDIPTAEAIEVDDQSIYVKPPETEKPSDRLIEK